MMVDQHPDVVALLHGDLPSADAAAATRHLEGCTTCREALPQTLLAHSLLTRAASTREDASRVPLLQRIDRAAEERPRLGLPELDREDPAAPDSSVRRRTRWVPGSAAAALAAAVAAGGLLLADGGTEDAPAERAAASTANVVLQPLDGSGSGQVSMTSAPDGSTAMAISADLPPAGPDSYYYVWLLDPETDKLLPVGQVPADGSATFGLSPELVASYGVVDVSLEPDDGDPAHSVDSVLRAAYPGPTAP